MMPKSRSSGSASSVLLANPIQNYYEIGEQSGTAGPENVWRIYKGYSKSDAKEVSIFLFDKKLAEKPFQPKRKEHVAHILRTAAQRMENFTHPKLLQVHRVEECADTLAFVSEPVIASLANILAYREQLSRQAVDKGLISAGHRSVYRKEYDFLDIEIQYGLAQITEALLFLHENRKLLHRNVCPASIIITKRATWKLSGFEFIQEVNRMWMSVPSWTSGMPKMTQPNLDYVAPEIQLRQSGSFYSDMYSLGMTMCAIFNDGRALIQANHSCSEYSKQIKNFGELVNRVIPRLPQQLVAIVASLLHEVPEKRPSAQCLLSEEYFRNPIVQTLQFLDVRKMKVVQEKEHFYTKTLITMLPDIPRKLWYQHIWTYLRAELESQEVLSAVLQPILYIVRESTQDEYEEIVFPTIRCLFANRKSIQGTVTLLENLRLILNKTNQEYVKKEVLPMLYMAFENSTTQVQTAAFVAVPNVMDYIDDEAIRKCILPKLWQAFQKNSINPRVLMNVIPCILDRLEKEKIIDGILPLLFNVKLQDPVIVIQVVNIYRLMLTDNKYGLSVNLMATQAMPSLLPQIVNPTLNLEQFELVLAVLHDMLGHVERHQREELTRGDILTLPRQHYTTRSAENVARKDSFGSISMTASAENMTKRNSMAAIVGGWLSSSSTNDGNFLRVTNLFNSRRLSDNTLMTPKIRLTASCLSSPGGTSGGGLPVRRHSSTGPQERRGSSNNLSPPTCGGQPITSSSAPYLHSPGMSSARDSRRPSVSSTSSQKGIGLFQQVGASMSQFLGK